MIYTIYNKRLGRKLNHPKYGLWCTPDLKEAQDMLKACVEYLISLNIPESEFTNFVVWEVENDKEFE